MLEEEQKLWKSNKGELQDTGRSDMLGMDTDENVSMSQNTDFGLLDSMLNKVSKQEDSEDKALAMRDTVVETVAPYGMSQVTTGQQEKIMFDASIRTDKTLVIGKEDGKLHEESLNQQIVPPSIECTP